MHRHLLLCIIYCSNRRHQEGCTLFRNGVRTGTLVINCNRQVDLMEESEEEGEKPLTRTCAANSNVVAEPDVCRAKSLP